MAAQSVVFMNESCVKIAVFAAGFVCKVFLEIFVTTNLPLVDVSI